MTRMVSPEQFAAEIPVLVNSIGSDSYLIRREGELVAALVTAEEYELIRQARGRRAIAAMNRISDAIAASGATEEELKELESALDRKA